MLSPICLDASTEYYTYSKAGVASLRHDAVSMRSHHGGRARQPAGLPVSLADDGDDDVEFQL